MNEEKKIYQKPILYSKFLNIIDQNIRDSRMDPEEKHTLLYLIWKARPGYCNCENSHKTGMFCDKCGKKISHNKKAPQNSKKHGSPILAPAWLRLLREDVRKLQISFEEKRTLLYLIWKEQAGNCDCEEVHKAGTFCDNCGKKIWHTKNKPSATEVITTQLKNKEDKNL